MTGSTRPPKSPRTVPTLLPALYALFMPSSSAILRGMTVRRISSVFGVRNLLIFAMVAEFSGSPTAATLPVLPETTNFPFFSSPENPGYRLSYKARSLSLSIGPLSGTGPSKKSVVRTPSGDTVFLTVLFPFSGSSTPRSMSAAWAWPTFFFPGRSSTTVLGFTSDNTGPPVKEASLFNMELYRSMPSASACRSWTTGLPTLMEPAMPSRKLVAPGPVNPDSICCDVPMSAGRVAPAVIVAMGTLT